MNVNIKMGDVLTCVLTWMEVTLVPVLKDLRLEMTCTIVQVDTFSLFFLLLPKFSCAYAICKTADNVKEQYNLNF